MGRGNKEKGKNPMKLAKKKKKKNAGGSSKGEDNDMMNSETNDQGSDVVDENNAPSEGEDPTGMITPASPSELHRGGEKTLNEGEADQKTPLSEAQPEEKNISLLSANQKENKMSEKRGDHHFRDQGESCYSTGGGEMGTKVKCSSGTPQWDGPSKRSENSKEETQRKCLRQGIDGSATQGGGDPQKGLKEVKGSHPEEEPNSTEIDADSGRSKKGKKIMQRYEPSVKVNLAKGENVGGPFPGGEHPGEAKSYSEGPNRVVGGGEITAEYAPSGWDYPPERGNNAHAEERQPMEDQTKTIQTNRTNGNKRMDHSKEEAPNDYTCSTTPAGEDANRPPPKEENIPLNELLYETTERAKKYNRTNYGLMGILKVIKMTDPQLNILALGTDLTTLGLNLNSPEFLFSSFTSPVCDDPTYNEDHFVKPSCYLNTRFQIRLSLLLKLQTETLFYIFYNLPRDVLQAYAASELYLRKWTYHMSYKKWFFPRSSLNQGNLTSCSSWVYFDPLTWSKKMYNNFISVKEMMHVQDVTRCIEQIIQVQSNCAAGGCGPPNCGDPSKAASQKGDSSKGASPQGASSPVGGADTTG
ncbi:CCR4-NOT transcription complex subunit 2, putative [Plasmodium vivax]|uniref:CCR4-NOT transcription complex subunit 2, putative n=1 Tax=Plasmodium vivax TaxID=5855 RepID=A0A564ZV01_PLAVI|nr:CCR4-NOT transcription complex subunit 2, putative [Plasmodium vivax]